MTPKEYRTKLDALKKQELELTEEFVNDNPFKGLEGKLVNLTIGCSRQKVLFVGAACLDRRTFRRSDKRFLPDTETGGRTQNFS